MKELADIARFWETRPGESFALATLIRAEGSSYRRPGARMLIASDGTTTGSLSGGCLEAEVAERGVAVLRSGLPVVMEFDTRRRFGCHGRIEILVERVADAFLEGLTAGLRDRRICRAVSEPGSGSRLLLPDESAPADAFLQIMQPPIQLIVFGEGPDTEPLRALAATLGWPVIVAEQAADLPTTADARTAAIVKSHNYGRDCAALRQLLQMGLRYVGLLGPRRRRDEILGDLLDSGVAFSSELFAPAGLNLGGETPEEIALAIVAEIQHVFAEGSAESLRDRKAPIHGWNTTLVTQL